MTRTTHAPRGGRFRTILGYASLALVLLLAVAAVRGYRDLQLARERAARIETEIERAEADIERLERSIERLRHDPEMLERLAREELGMVKPGEVVVLLEPEDPASRPRAVTTRPLAGPSSDPREPASP